MKAGLLITGNGPLVILTSHNHFIDDDLLQRLRNKGIQKFIIHEIPLEIAKERYGGHYESVVRDQHETDDLRVLDIDGKRAFSLFSFGELGSPIYHEAH